MSEAVIRPASEADIEGIANLQQQWLDEDITWGYYADPPEEISKYVREHCFVAEQDGKLIGYAFGAVVTKPYMAALPDEPCFEIVDIYMAPPFRSHDVGGKLLEVLIESARKIGIKNFRLHSGTKDIAKAVSFYNRHGFDVVSVTMVRKDQ